MYSISEEKIEKVYTSYFGEKEMPESVRELICCCTSMCIDAYEAGKKGKSLLIVCPWIKEVK